MISAASTFEQGECVELDAPIRRSYIYPQAFAMRSTY